MTQVNFHPKINDLVTPQVALFRFSFVDASTGECIADSKVRETMCFNTTDKSFKRISDVLNSYIRGFLSGKDIALVLELVHPEERKEEIIF